MVSFREDSPLVIKSFSESGYAHFCNMKTHAFMKALSTSKCNHVTYYHHAGAHEGKEHLTPKDAVEQCLDNKLLGGFKWFYLIWKVL